MKRTIDIELELQPLINVIPPQYGDLYKRACSGDGVTIETWRQTWIKNYGLAKERFKEFGPKSYGQLHGLNRHRPAIVIGSGPSLANSVKALQQNKRQKTPVLSISCLHNFGFFQDKTDESGDCHADYYLTLDSGPVTIADMTEGCKKDAQYYWDKTRDHTLLANVASDPGLFDKWQGKLYLFNTLIPDVGIREAFEKIERFSHFISSGGNALGGCQYTAKAVMGSSEIIFVGADFCFSYDHQFHPWKSQYDSFSGNGVGNVVRAPDIYGLPRCTWPSYQNFAFYLNWLSMSVPGRWVSASEGILGAFPEGNLNSFRYMSLESALEVYRIADQVFLGETKVENGIAIPVLSPDGTVSRKPLNLEEMFKDSKQPYDITFF